MHATKETAAELRTHKKPDVSYTQNRELSWLQFENRMLEEASDATVPLFERLTFVSIFTTNLDEFFRVRVGSLFDLEAWAPDDRDNKSLHTPREQLEAVFEAVRPLVKSRDKVYAKLMKKLAAHGIVEVDLDALGKKERKWARDHFRAFVHPLLSAQVIDERHPFPFLHNKGLYIVMSLSDGAGSQEMGMVPVPADLPPYIADPENPLHFVRMERLILHNVEKLFPNYTVSDACIVSVTRNADIDLDDDKFDDSEIDYRAFVARMLKKRNRLNPVRLEVEGKLSKTLLAMLLARLDLSETQVFSSVCPLCANWAFALQDALPASLRAELCYEPHQPRDSKVFDEGRSILAQIEEHDRVLFYPYDSMRPFLGMLKEAAQDPSVVSVKITLYRLASDSRVASYLAEAAENGKEVTVLMELRARFDEANNIEWSRRMEEAGCNIIYGPDDYKCHSKICLVTRRAGERVQNFVQIGTGNYNEKTARLYADICLMTADERIGRDAVAFFQNMLIGNLNGAYETLLVAPANMKRTYLALMDKEIAKGSAGRIMLKANSLTERDIIDKLSEASRAGVQVQLNLRSICCLLPGIEGKTDNIRVRSVAGRFLEHARVYCFGVGEGMQVYISSADLMTRNLVHRVEIGVHVLDPLVKEDIVRYMHKLFEDNCKARELQPDGSYRLPERGKGDPRVCAQEYFAAEPLQHLDLLEAEHDAAHKRGQGGFFTRLFARWRKK